jgi:hypothetical protein
MQALQNVTAAYRPRSGAQWLGMLRQQIVRTRRRNDPSDAANDLPGPLEYIPGRTLEPP